jgi:hypothetical protein
LKFLGAPRAAPSVGSEIGASVTIVAAGIAAVDRRRVDERLERRAGLPARLHRAVELAAAEVDAADHRLHLAGLRIDRDERALELGRSRRARSASRRRRRG